MCDWCIVLCYFCCLITLEENGVSGLFVSSTQHPSYSLLPSYHLLLSHLTTTLLSHLTTTLLSHLTTSYHQLVTPLLSLTHIFALLPPISLVSSLSPHLLLLLISSAILLLYQLANFPLVNPAPTQLLFSKHSISKNRTFFLISHYYHFTMKT